MPASNTRTSFKSLSCLVTACVAPAAVALAMVPGVVMAQIQPPIGAQVEPRLLPSLVLPPDAMAGPPAFAPNMRMGDSAMLRGNIVRARALYERAAALYPASSAALLAVGKTYDPNVLAPLGSSSSFADADKARQWYERALALGDPAAARLLARLP